MKNLKTKPLQAFFWSFAQILGGGLITFLVGVYLARILEPADFGLIGMIAIFMAIGQSLIDSGLASSLIRTQDADERDYSTVFFINLVGSFVVYAACFFAAPYIAIFYEQPIITKLLRTYSLGFLIIALVIVQKTKMSKELDFKTQLKAQLPASIISGILGITLANFGYGVWSLVYMYLVQQMLLTLLYWHFSNWRPRWIFDVDRFKYHFTYGYKLTISGIMSVVMLNSYYVVIGKFFSPTLLGFYTRAIQTRQLPVDFLGRALNRVTFPLFSSMQEDPKQLKLEAKKLLGQVFFCLIPILLGAITLANPLFEFLFTEKWLPAVPYFQLLCIVGLYFPLHNFNLDIIKIYGRSDLFLQLTIIKQLLVLINVLVAIKYGIYALLVGQIINTNIAYFINSYYTYQYIKYGMVEQLKDLIPLFGVGVFSMSLVYYLDLTFFLNFSSWQRLLIGSLIGGGVYFFTAWFNRLLAYQYFCQLLDIGKIMLLKRGKSYL